jgi:hypothetical protein
MIGCTISVDEVAIIDQEDQLLPSHRTADIPHVTPASVRYRPIADISSLLPMFRRRISRWCKKVLTSSPKPQ